MLSELVATRGQSLQALLLGVVTEEVLRTRNVALAEVFDRTFVTADRWLSEAPDLRCEGIVALLGLS